MSNSTSQDNTRSEDQGATSPAANGVGLAISAEDFFRSYRRHDGTGMIVSGVAFAGNSTVLALKGIGSSRKVQNMIADVILRAGDEKAEIIEREIVKDASRLETASRFAGPLLTVADIVYATYRENGHFINRDGTLGHKSERLIASSLTASAGIGAGALLSGGSTLIIGGTVVAGTATGIAEAAATGTAVAGGAAVGGAAGLATAAAPVLLAAVASYEVGKATQIAIDTRRVYEKKDSEETQFFRATKIEALSGPKPAIYEFKNLPAVAAFISGRMRDDHLSGPQERYPNGCIKPQALRNLDMSDSRNLREFQAAIDAEVKQQEQIARDNDSILPRWIRHGDSVERFNNAQAELKQLRAAREELTQYTAEVKACEGPPKDPAPASSRSLSRSPRQSTPNTSHT